MKWDCCESSWQILMKKLQSCRLSMDLRRLFGKWSPSDPFSAWRIKGCSNPLAARGKKQTFCAKPGEIKMMAKLNSVGCFGKQTQLFQSFFYPKNVPCFFWRDGDTFGVAPLPKTVTNRMIWNIFRFRIVVNRNICHQPASRVPYPS